MTGRIQLEKSSFVGQTEERMRAEHAQGLFLPFRFGGPCRPAGEPPGHIVVLPYQGQQVWDVVFRGRRLTMSNFFPQPIPSPHLLDSYGMFLYHCGALRMGNPGPQDNHPLHGELPAAPYSDAWLVMGEDEGRRLPGSLGRVRVRKGVRGHLPRDTGGAAVRGPHGARHQHDHREPLPLPDGPDVHVPRELPSRA